MERLSYLLQSLNHETTHFIFLLLLVIWWFDYSTTTFEHMCHPFAYETVWGESCDSPSNCSIEHRHQPQPMNKFFLGLLAVSSITTPAFSGYQYDGVYLMDGSDFGSDPYATEIINTSHINWCSVFDGQFHHVSHL